MSTVHERQSLHGLRELPVECEHKCDLLSVSKVVANLAQFTDENFSELVETAPSKVVCSLAN